LRTGDDITIADFEGNADRFLDERRLKESPLRDVADLLYSLRYAVAMAREGRGATGERRETSASVDRLLRSWYREVGSGFVAAWRSRLDRRLLPETEDELATLLDAFLLEKALSQVAWRLDSQRDRLDLALGIVLDLLAEADGGQVH
jgi:maltose alpha-D-glucosyltransferase/alpha-amylase